MATFCIYYFIRKIQLYSVEIQTLWKGRGIAEEQLSGEGQRLLEQCWLTHSEDTEQMPPLGWGSAKALECWEKTEEGHVQFLETHFFGNQGRRHGSSMENLFLCLKRKLFLTYGIYILFRVTLTCISCWELSCLPNDVIRWTKLCIGFHNMNSFLHPPFSCCCHICSRCMLAAVLCLQ